MSPFVLIGLLSFSFLLPIFTNSDDEDNIAEPADLTPPETTVEGTAGNDTLTADSGETINAGDGADVLGFEGDASNA